MALLVAAVVLGTASASADTRFRRDAMDYGGGLDIRAVRHSHGPKASRIRHTVRMYGNWRSRALRSSHYSIGIYFDINRPREEREIWIKYRNGKLRAYMVVLELTRSGKVKDIRRDGSVDVWRPDSRTLRVAFGAGRLNLRRRTYRWSVVLTPDGVCPGSCESDFAPESEKILHRL